MSSALASRCISHASNGYFPLMRLTIALGLMPAILAASSWVRSCSMNFTRRLKNLCRMGYSPFLSNRSATSTPRARATCRALLSLTLFPHRMAETVIRETSAFSASAFTVKSCRAISEISFTRSILICIHLALTQALACVIMIAQSTDCVNAKTQSFLLVFFLYTCYSYK